MTIFLLAITALTAPADPHEKLNPLYRDLRVAGLEIGAETPVKFPAPLFPDGLTGEQQQATLKKILGEDFNYAEFTRNSQLAPNKLVIREITPAAPRSLTRQIEVVFVAYGDLAVVANKDFLDRVLDLNRKEGKASSIPREKLQTRGIVLSEKQAKHEGYGHLVLNLLDKVELTATGRSIWSQTPDSIVVAGRLDPRFRNDAEFPNLWKPILLGREGKKTLGKATPYDGAGYYVKITKMTQPAGALLVEGHILLSEPEGWFEGTNLLSSKLPPVLQKQVRSFRRELIQASSK